MEDDKAKEYLMYSDGKSRKELNIYGFDRIKCQLSIAINYFSFTVS